MMPTSKLAAAAPLLLALASIFTSSASAVKPLVHYPACEAANKPDVSPRAMTIAKKSPIVVYETPTYGDMFQADYLPSSFGTVVIITEKPLGREHFQRVHNVVSITIDNVVHYYKIARFRGCAVEVSNSPIQSMQLYLAQ